MRVADKLAIALFAIALPAKLSAQQTAVVINLTEQAAYLLEDGRVAFVSPIASGKGGWATPTGNFRIFNKDIDHRSRSFGSVFDAHGSMVNSNATPGSHVPPGGHYRSAPMPYFMEFSPEVGMHAGYLPGYPASHGCIRMPKDLAAEFFARVHIGTSVKVIGSARNVTHVRRAIPIVQPGNSRYATALFNSKTGTEWPLGLQYRGIPGKKYAGYEPGASLTPRSNSNRNGRPTTQPIRPGVPIWQRLLRPSMQNRIRVSTFSQVDD